MSASRRDENESVTRDSAAHEPAGGYNRPTIDSPLLAKRTAAMTAPNALALIGLANGAEVQTGQIAREKATSAEVREYAKMLVTDHQAMQKEADELATRASLTPQPPPQADQKRAAGDQMVQQLTAAAKGPAFDRSFVEGQIQAHQQTLTELQQLQTSVDNADVKALIEKAIPKVQDHLARAQKLQGGLK